MEQIEIKTFNDFCDYLIGISESLMQMLANLPGIRIEEIRREAAHFAMGRDPKERIELGDIYLIRAIAMFEQAVLKHVEIEKTNSLKKLIESV